MHISGTAVSAADLLAQLHTFLTTNGSAFGVTCVGMGNGTLTGYSGGPASLAERITLTAQSPTSFSVEGNLSGALGTATVGVPFSCAQAAFTIQAGTNAFQAGDVLYMQTAPAWKALRTDTVKGYIWQAPGNDGAQAIYIGALPPPAGSSYLQLCGFTGYTAAAAFNAQPGYPTYSSYTHGVMLSMSAFPFWLVADGQRFILVARPLAGYYQAAYMGFAETFVDRVSYPYPLVIGTTNLGGAALNTSSSQNMCFPCSQYDQLLLRTPPGISLRADGWASYTTNNYGTGGCGIQPHTNGLTTNALANLGQNLDGSTPIFPTVLFSKSDKHTIAQLAGVHVVPGSGLTAENLLTFGGLQHLVVTNVNRTTNSDYFTVALD